MECTIRIYVYCDSNRNLLPNANGHYDIGFVTSNATFDGRSYVNPVFS